MPVDSNLFSVNAAIGVLLVDILLSGDNAIVIALVCRTLVKEDRIRALWLGMAGAFMARLVLTSSASLIMRLPFIKLIGGLLLLKISIELIVNNSLSDHLPFDAQQLVPSDIYTAAKTIIIADVVMSLDNVLALSAITQGNFTMLTVGLLMSIPILMFGSLYIARLLDVFPHFLWFGAAMLGGVSGSLMVQDRLFGDAFVNASSVTNLVAPLLAALYVVIQSNIVLGNRSGMRQTLMPRSIWSILWNHSPTTDGPTMNSSHLMKRDIVGSDTAMSITQSVIARARSVQKVVHVVSASQADQRDSTFLRKYRVFIAVGLGIFVLAFGIDLIVNSSFMPLPAGFITYKCEEPAMSISYRPNAKQIRFNSAKGFISTEVVEDRIVWKDYHVAGITLSVPPPVKIISADPSRLIIDGGMFRHVACFASKE